MPPVVPVARPTPRSLFAWLVAGCTADPFTVTVAEELNLMSGPPGLLVSGSPLAAKATPIAALVSPVPYSVCVNPGASDENGGVSALAVLATQSDPIAPAMNTNAALSSFNARASLPILLAERPGDPQCDPNVALGARATWPNAIPTFLDQRGW